ncbi:MAG: hypothetical protein JEZ07_16475 [Phycisphaerae bacterium]|nr:hypothetical protein [Phycisphaerae bacterium]
MKSDSYSCDAICDVTCAEVAKTDPDLMKICQAWGSLTEAKKMAIMEMLKGKK